MRDGKHLLPTPYGYYLRVVVPKDLREKLGKREIKKTLSTFDYSLVIRVARYLLIEIERVFFTLRGADVVRGYRLNLPITDMIVRDFD